VGVLSNTSKEGVMAEDKKSSERVGKIYQQIPLIMADIKAIGKDQQNVQQNFKYRGIDDVYNELQKHLAKHKVFTVPQVLADQHGVWKTSTGKDMNHRILTVEYKFYAEDGSCVEAVVMGEALDLGDKAASKALAIAHKYALFQVFCIPTDDPNKDPDQESHQATRQNGGNGKPAPGSQDKVHQGGFVPMIIDGQETNIDYFEVLKMFQNAKAGIIKVAGEKEGKSAYYDVLGGHGFEKSNMIPKGKMMLVFQDLKNKFRELRDEAEEGQKGADKDKDKGETKKDTKKDDDPDKVQHGEKTYTNDPKKAAGGDGEVPF
jgi:hypothetical protein